MFDMLCVSPKSRFDRSPGILGIEIVYDDSCAAQVTPGARVAADGDITAGHSYVDESMLTGEPAAVPKAPGSMVMGGTLNAGGVLHMRTTRAGSDTALAHIVQVITPTRPFR